MEKLTKALVEIQTNFGKKSDILTREYGESNLLDIWNSQIPTFTQASAEEWDNILNALQIVLRLNFPNSNSFNAVTSKFRKPIKKANFIAPYRQSLIILGRSKEEAIQQKEKYKASVLKKNEERAKLPVVYIDDILEKIPILIASDNIYENAIGVMLATQTRSIEVFFCATFNLNQDTSLITISGLAKSSDSSKTVTKKVVGCSGLDIINCISKIRLKFSDRENSSMPVGCGDEQLKSFINTHLNEAFRKHIHLEMTAHKSRYIGAHISYMLFAKQTDIPEIVYIQKILAHQSPESTLSYLSINVKYKQEVIDSAPEHIRKIIYQLQNKVLELSQKNTPCDLSPFRNSGARNISAEDKIKKCLDAIRLVKQSGVKMTQIQMREHLGYSSNLVSKAYEIARQEGIL